MDKKKSWKNHLPSRRRLIQLYAALLYNANLKGFAEGQINTDNGKNFCVPGLNCYSCPGAVGACPLGSLQNALASSRHRGPYYVIGFLMLLGLLFGRLICGFLCPFGLIQELLHKIPTPKLQKNRFTHILSYLKYIILVVFVILIPLMYSVQSYPVPAFCKYICPAGTLEGAIGLLSNAVNADKFSMLNILFTRKVVILILVLTLCVFCYRPFCRFLCPLGAIYGLFCRVALLGVEVDSDLCTNCGLCVRACKMDVCRVGDHECIQCGECRKVCPTGAIFWKCPGKKPEKTVEKNTDTPGQKKRKKLFKNAHRAEGILWIAALLFLAGVLWYYNHPETKETVTVVEETEAESEIATESASETEASTAPKDLETGEEVGMLCPDFTVPLYGGGAFDLAEEKENGKIIVINFWATWCTPCCAELPYFQQISEEYADEVTVIAIHSSLVTDDVEEYLDEMGYEMNFALDETGDVIASLGGSTMLPMTVILDPDGIIVYNQVGSVTYELLAAQIKALL